MELTMQIADRYLYVCEYQKKLDWKTVKAYRTDLRQFLEYLAGCGEGFNRETIQSYTAHMNQKYKPRSVKRKLASIRAFKTWLLGEGLMKENPFENLCMKVQEPTLLPRIIPLREIGKLLAEVHAKMALNPGDRTAVRDAAVMELLFATGIRVSELSGIKTEEVDLSDGIIRICGKGSKERILYIENPEVLSILRLYADTYQPERGGPFFLNRDGHRLSEQSIRDILKKYADLAHIPTRVTPHMFRHTLATLLLEEDVDIRYIQRLLGHSSIVTTQIYTHVAGGKLREIMSDKHPRNKLSFQPRQRAAAEEGKMYRNLHLSDENMKDNT